LSSAIDAFSNRVGSTVKWLILVAVVISAANAIVRKLLNTSSNAWLEAQWYLFGAVFMLAAGYTFLKNEHIRIDVVTSHFSKRMRDWIDVVGHVLFLTPFCWIMIWHGLPFFWRSFTINEQSMNAGGLVVWPAKILVPLGFAFLLIQGASELIKRVAILRGDLEDEHAAAGHHAAAEAEAQRLLDIAQEAGLADRK
jgi:TRAP-type mannitol/chloroaromatic compound transport system permease small subunit